MRLAKEARRQCAAPHVRIAGALPPLTLSGLKASFVGAFAGFTPAVWGVVVLKALNGLIIPATFKYADNIVYSYAKPSSIVVTTVLGAVLAGQLPAPSLVAGDTRNR